MGAVMANPNCLHCRIIKTIREWSDEHQAVGEKGAASDVLVALAQCAAEIVYMAPDRDQRRVAKKLVAESISAAYRAEATGQTQEIVIGGAETHH